ncbi:hypothetical protein LCGC14_2271470, partial [marine sediment metagenome]
VQQGQHPIFGALQYASDSVNKAVKLIQGRKQLDILQQEQDRLRLGDRFDQFMRIFEHVETKEGSLASWKMMEGLFRGWFEDARIPRDEVNTFFSGLSKADPSAKETLQIGFQAAMAGDFSSQKLLAEQEKRKREDEAAATRAAAIGKEAPSLEAKEDKKFTLAEAKERARQAGVTPPGDVQELTPTEAKLNLAEAEKRAQQAKMVPPGDKEVLGEVEKTLTQQERAARALERLTPPSTKRAPFWEREKMVKEAPPTVKKPGRAPLKTMDTAQAWKQAVKTKDTEIIKEVIPITGVKNKAKQYKAGEDLVVGFSELARGDSEAGMAKINKATKNAEWTIDKYRSDDMAFKIINNFGGTDDFEVNRKRLINAFNVDLLNAESKAREVKLAEDEITALKDLEVSLQLSDSFGGKTIKVNGLGMAALSSLINAVNGMELLLLQKEGFNEKGEGKLLAEGEAAAIAEVRKAMWEYKDLSIKDFWTKLNELYYKKGGTFKSSWHITWRWQLDRHKQGFEDPKTGEWRQLTEADMVPQEFKKDAHWIPFAKYLFPWLGAGTTPPIPGGLIPGSRLAGAGQTVRNNSPAR